MSTPLPHPLPTDVYIHSSFSVFFSKGHLTGKLKSDFTAASLISEIARWTKSYPQALPVPLRVVREIDRSEYSQQERKGRIVTAVNDLLCALDLFGYKLNIRLPPSTEPIAGSVEDLLQWDNRGIVWLVSAAYVLLRLGWILSKR